ncbi:hypothetical protein SAMN05880501_101717 [Ureibacillus xyleni]|uniref:PB1 domain-containing protein n=1 Tax=Ureibacillus xyleni TaxID=614648 RepID=A0A285RN85_9BACL|nr:hypothetical protein [Ureibacillus xyleni]SOB93902.1 hypothetical protein SAMN05880501_101717 [Ureibacillus xyleni]
MSKVKITSIILIVLLLLGGVLMIVNDVSDKAKSFSEEEIAAASEIAQNELSQAFVAAESFPFEERAEAIQSIGYSEPEIEKTTMTFEKHNEGDVYILLKLQPHESYENLSRVLVQIFDKENGSLITELSNVLNWKDS